MSVIATMTQHYSNVVKREFGPEWGYAKQKVTFNGAAATLQIGAVLGSYIASPTITAGAVVGTGNGTVGTISATSTRFLQLGVYTVKFLTATTFQVNDTFGALIGTGATGTAFSQNGLTFTITAGGTAFVAGDTIPLTVSGTVKYKLVEATATDGSQIARVVMVGDAQGRPMPTTTTANTDVTMLVIYRGPVAVQDIGLSYGASVTAGALTTAAQNQLIAAGIDVLTGL